MCIGQLLDKFVQVSPNQSLTWQIASDLYVFVSPDEVDLIFIWKFCWSLTIDNNVDLLPDSLPVGDLHVILTEALEVASVCLVGHYPQ